MKIEMTVKLDSTEVDAILVAHVEKVVGPPPAGMRYHCELKSWGEAEVETRAITPLPTPVDDPPAAPSSL
jgi:hypothetical protein